VTASAGLKPVADDVSSWQENKRSFRLLVR
jgi:hypothetical protein